MPIRLLRTRVPYLHSPLDDLESFYYTAQWAVAFNDGASGGRYNGTGIQGLREMIAGRDRAQAIDKLTSLCSLAAEVEYGPFFARSLPLLASWWFKFLTLRRDWSKVLYDCGLRKEEDLRLNFLIYGYRGVVEYLELVHEHRESLQGAT